MMRCKLPISAGINHITCHNGGSRESPATGSAGTDLQIPPVSQDLTSLRPLPLGIGLGREHKTPTHPFPLHLCCPSPHRHSAGEALHLLGESGVRVVTFALSVFLSSLSLSLSLLSLSLSLARALSLLCCAGCTNASQLSFDLHRMEQRGKEECGSYILCLGMPSLCWTPRLRRILLLLLHFPLPSPLVTHMEEKEEEKEAAVSEEVMVVEALAAGWRTKKQHWAGGCGWTASVRCCWRRGGLVRGSRLGGLAFSPGLPSPVLQEEGVERRACDA